MLDLMDDAKWFVIMVIGLAACITIGVVFFQITEEHKAGASYEACKTIQEESVRAGCIDGVTHGKEEKKGK